MPLPLLANVASSLGLKFRANPFDGPGGAGLRGFYVATKALKQPLVCLNTAHRRTAINSAFWHEVWHHLTARLLSPQEESTALSFGSDFDEHLNDPRELAADMLASLVCYSQSAAKRLFGPLLRKDSAENHSHGRFRWEDSPELSMGIQFREAGSGDAESALTGWMIHFARLRLAL